MNIKNSVSRFLSGYFATNDRQPKTKAAYTTDLRQFEEFAGSRRSLVSIDRTQIESWAADLKEKDYSPASIRRKLVVLKVFFGYWVRNGHISESPFWRVKISIGKIVNLPRSLTEDEMKGLLEQAHRSAPAVGNISQKPALTQNTESFRVLRDKAIVELLFATGLRVGELSAIDVDDFISDDAAFRVRGKGRKERLAFIVDKVASKTHRDYLRARRKLATDSCALFVNASGKRLSTQGIANVIKRIQMDSKVTRHVTPHMLRHTVATLLLRNGTDIRVVQEFLGHASIATTQRYTHVAKEHLINELLARHPSLVFRR